MNHRALRLVAPTEEETNLALEIFQANPSEYPGGRIDCLDNLDRLVMVKRAVKAGFYNEKWTSLLNYCTGCVPCSGTRTCRCDCHVYIPLPF